MIKLPKPKHKKVKLAFISSLKNKARKIFSEYIRLRDCFKTTGTLTYGRCVTCNKAFDFKQLQCGHFIQGRHNSVFFHEQNSHAQCVGCNIFLKGKLIDYTLYMQQTYGNDIVEELRRLDRQLKKFTRYEYERIIKDYSSKIRYLRSL
jgi:hypothetical protein